MKTIIETTQLELGKSNFLIDLVKHQNGLLYVELTQIITDASQEKNVIKINPTVLSDIIAVLQNYHAKISSKPDFEYKHITDIEQQKIQDRYLKGISIKDLAMQFNQSTQLIEMILRNKGIEIVENEPPKTKFWKTHYKNKKKK